MQRAKRQLSTNKHAISGTVEAYPMGYGAALG